MNWGNIIRLAPKSHPVGIFLKDTAEWTQISQNKEFKKGWCHSLNIFPLMWSKDVKTIEEYEVNLHLHVYTLLGLHLGRLLSPILLCNSSCNRTLKLFINMHNPHFQGLCEEAVLIDASTQDTSLFCLHVTFSWVTWLLVYLLALLGKYYGLLSCAATTPAYLSCLPACFSCLIDFCNHMNSCINI